MVGKKSKYAVLNVQTKFPCLGDKIAYRNSSNYLIRAEVDKISTGYVRATNKFGSNWINKDDIVYTASKWDILEQKIQRRL